jgi:RNA polymerase sigma factor (TIGR02999 family)
MENVEALLAAVRGGDAVALGRLLTLLYDDLRRLARARLRHAGELTLLDTTAVVHESVIRLVGLRTLQVQDRTHFFAYASQVMRAVIVDYARARAAGRRGGAYSAITLDTAAWQELPAPDADAARVSEAVDVLEQADPRLARVVEMRYFGGFTETEIAQALALHERTVRRDLVKARLLLREMLA